MTLSAIALKGNIYLMNNRFTKTAGIKWQNNYTLNLS